MGCGTGVHSIGYVVVGVKSYTGVDPFIKLDKDRAKNLRTRQWEEGFGWTPREVMEQFKRVELIPGKFEDIDSARLFDVAILHNVTEHLMRIDEVIEGIYLPQAVGERFHLVGVEAFVEHCVDVPERCGCLRERCTSLVGHVELPCPGVGRRRFSRDVARIEQSNRHGGDGTFSLCERDATCCWFVGPF